MKTLSELFRKTAEEHSPEWIAEWGGGAKKPCPCCNGTGEHGQGECQLCDGGMTVSEKTPDDAQGRDCFKTGTRQPYTEDVNDDRPVIMQYHRNTTPAPRQVNHYHGQDIEPHGQYFTQGPMHGDIPGYETGEKSFQRPLRLFSPTDDPSQPHHWKQQLQRRYNATGKALSQAIRNDGYDAILTHDEYGPSESVDLTSFRPRRAAEDAGVYRGLSLVLPPHVHQMVHDPSQPVEDRAHALLGEIRKQKETHQGEDATGQAGGLGSFWTPSQAKGSEYAEQSGWSAYREHEREHNCGDPDYGDGGCQTTRVLLHAHTPDAEHHWTEVFRPGERYDPELSWRLPIRPGTPMRVRHISWKEGNDNLPLEQTFGDSQREYEAKPYTSHDFLEDVHKHAKVTFGPGADESIGEDHYDEDDGFHQKMWDQWHPKLQQEIHRHIGLNLPGSHPAHNEKLPMDERARAVLYDTMMRGNVGTHWTDDPDYKHLSGDRVVPGETAVTLHASTPPRQHIEDNSWTLEDRAVRDWDMDPEREVPLKRNAPVEVHGITWNTAKGPVRHDFTSPIRVHAGANGDLPEGLTFSHRHQGGMHTVLAHPGGDQRYAVGELTWHDHERPGPDPKDGWCETCEDEYPVGHHSHPAGEVDGIQVMKGERRKGIASAMWDYAHSLNVTPKPVHSADQTEAGSSWARTTASYTHDHAWLPQGRYWGPNSAQNDQRIFDGDHLRPEVRQDILGRVNAFMRPRYRQWPSWTKVYFAGSEAAKWQPFNGDFDILIGIDFDKFRQDNPDWDDKSDDEIASEMTDGMWKTINVDGYWFTLQDGRQVGPFDRTFFVNPRAWDIRNLKPYAAYDVTDDTWAVHPLEVPKDWSAKSLPESYWDYAETLANEIRAIGKLPPEERQRMARNLWEELHTHRSDAFSGNGKGIFDLSNIVEKYLDQHPDKPWKKLTDWMNSGTSTTAKRRTLSMLFRAKDEPEGADYDGIMIALVPPKRIGRKLLVEDGEPLEALHVTLCYLGSSTEHTKAQMDGLESLVTAWARTQKPLKAHVGGVGTFVNPDAHVLWAAVDIPGGGGVRHSLDELLQEHGYKVRNDHGWTPHITLSYSKDHVRFLPKVEPSTWDVKEVMLCVGGTWTPIRLGG